MKRLVSKAPGGPETLVLETVDAPVPGPGEVLVDVRACAVNYPDALVIIDQYQFKPERPFSPGGEVAGVVEAVGRGVTWPGVGDRVMAMPLWGGMVEKMLLPAASCLPMAEDMPFEDGASFIMTYGTGYHALRQRAALAPGETLVVLGAAGGVGIAAVELGKAMGARVIAACSSEEKAKIARGHGADDVVVYPRGSLDSAGKKALSAKFKEACGPGGADVVYDSVGGDLTEVGARMLGWKGRLLIIGFPAGIAALPTNLLLLKGGSAVGVFYGDFIGREPEVNAENNKALLALYTAGKIKPHVSMRFPLERAAEAIGEMGKPAAYGKIVIDMEAHA